MTIPQARSILILLTAALWGSSCTDGRFYEQNREIANGSWAAHNNVSFSVVIEDTAATYDFYLNLRNDVNYPYSNLFLFLKTTFPDRRVARDTIECLLAGYDGKWMGSGTGSVRFNRFLFQKGVRFSSAGTYTFDLEQAMRVDPLIGIRDAGLRIEKQVEQGR
jgi:gliding motility-associated lipoprotein GldH